MNTNSNSSNTTQSSFKNKISNGQPRITDFAPATDPFERGTNIGKTRNPRQRCKRMVSESIGAQTINEFGATSQIPPLADGSLAFPENSKPQPISTKTPPALEAHAAGPLIVPAESQDFSKPQPAPRLKLVEFSLPMPTANIVQLAADFTEWEKFAINMVRFHDGVWWTNVPLPPGVYAYRFIVDGVWHDGPRPLCQSSGQAVIHIE